MTDPEPELIESPLNWSIERGGRRLKVNIVRLATERGWSLEVVNDHNTSIVWDDQFQTDRDEMQPSGPPWLTKALKPSSTKTETTALLLKVPTRGRYRMRTHCLGVCPLQTAAEAGWAGAA